MVPPHSTSELERVRYAFARMVGKYVQVQTMNGVVYEGILSGSNAGSSPTAQIGVALEMAYKKRDSKDKVDEPFVGPPVKPSREAVIEKLVINDDDVAQIAVAGLDLRFERAPPEGQDSFTDTGISGGFGRVTENRELKAWQPDPDVPQDIGGLGSGGFTADAMFKTAERNHNYKSTFNENDYTTEIDRSRPDFAQKEAEAARIAKDILQGGGRHSTNVHVMEDRGVVGDVNEESKYGAVSHGRYRPPQMRGSSSSNANPPAKAQSGGDSAVNQKSGKSAENGNSETPQEERKVVEDGLKDFSKSFRLDTDSKSDDKVEEGSSTTTPLGEGGTEDKSADAANKKDFKFNPKASEFKFNPGASEFKMSVPSSGNAAPAAAPQMTQHVRPVMHSNVPISVAPQQVPVGMQYYAHGHPGHPGMHVIYPMPGGGVPRPPNMYQGVVPQQYVGNPNMMSGMSPEMVAMQHQAMLQRPPHGSPRLPVRGMPPGPPNNPNGM